MIRPPPRSTLFPYPPLFRSLLELALERLVASGPRQVPQRTRQGRAAGLEGRHERRAPPHEDAGVPQRSEEHTSELQSLAYLVCRLLLEKKKTPRSQHAAWTA